MLHIAVLDDAMGGRYDDDSELHIAEKRLVDRLSAVVMSVSRTLLTTGIRRVTFVTKHAPRGLEGSDKNLGGAFGFEYKDNNEGTSTNNIAKEEVDPGVFTFRRGLEYAEDTLIRDLEPTLAFRLELERLSKFEVHHVFSRNRAIHVYHAMRESDELAKFPVERRFSSRKPKPQHRFFVRAMVRDDTANIALAVATNKNEGSDRQQPNPEALGDVLDAVVTKAHQDQTRHVWSAWTP